MKKLIILTFVLLTLLSVLPSLFSICTFGAETCVYLEEQNLLSQFYLNPSVIPEHDLIKELNENQILIIYPKNSIYVKNAYVHITNIYPLIQYKDKYYTTYNFSKEIITNYDIILPKNTYYTKKRNNKLCREEYYLTKNNSNLYSNYEDSNLTATYNVQVEIKQKQYFWDKDCGDNGCDWDCEYEYTNTLKDSIELNDSVKLIIYNNSKKSSYQITHNYSNTYKGLTKLTKNTIITSNTSEFKHYNYLFIPELNKYNQVYLKAIDTNSTNQQNTYFSNNNLYVQEGNCSIQTIDFFNQTTKPCSYNLAQTITTPKFAHSIQISLSLLIKLSLIFSILYLIYKAVKPKFFTILIILLIIPTVFAEYEQEEDCGITNIGVCFSESIYSFFYNLFNAPIEPLLGLVKTMLSITPEIELFKTMWKIIVYLLSFFYLLFLLYSGFTFIVSGHDVVKREIAKEWFQNIIIMIILVQASFYLYELFLELGASLTQSMLKLIPETFFLITLDNFINASLELLLGVIYALVLIGTLIILVIRYLILTIGILFVPFGIFFYFIPPLRSYGLFILQTLGILTIISFFISLIFLGASMMIEIETLSNIKIVIMIVSFIIANNMIYIFVKQTLLKTSLPSFTNSAMNGINYVREFRK